MANKIVDPVDEDKTVKEAELVEQMETMDAKNIKLTDLKGIKQKVIKGGSPFEGYPGNDIKIGRHKFMQHHIVFLNPNFYVNQDPANLGQTVKDTKTKQERIVDFKTFHSRMVQDGSKQNIDVVFDRVMAIEGTDMYYALVPDNVARAQIMFKIDKEKGRASVDRRYSLLDTGQSSRLKSVFDRFYYQMLSGERKATKYDG